MIAAYRAVGVAPEADPLSDRRSVAAPASRLGRLPPDQFERAHDNGERVLVATEERCRTASIAIASPEPAHRTHE